MFRIYLSSVVGTIDQFWTPALEASHPTPEKAISHYSPLLPFVSGTVEEFRQVSLEWSKDRTGLKTATPVLVLTLGETITVH